MSLGAGIFAHLAGSTSAGQRVYPFALPQGAVRPAITYRVIPGAGPLVSHADVQDGAGARPRHERVRVQFDCWADSWLGADALAEELISRVHGFRGTWGEVPIGSCLKETDLDERDPAVGTYRRVIDVMIQYDTGIAP